MTESFITVLNGVITGKHHGDMSADLFGSPYYGHEKIIVPFDAEMCPMEPLEFYAEDWRRKPDIQLIDEGLLPMPVGYAREGDELRPMTPEERVIEGLDEPRPGYKIHDGQIVTMTIQEQFAARQISRETYEESVIVENTSELQHRLAELQTPECIALADVNENYATERKKKLTALLAVKEQSGWPLKAVWPEE